MGKESETQISEEADKFFATLTVLPGQEHEIISAHQALEVMKALKILSSVGFVLELTLSASKE